MSMPKAMSLRHLLDGWFRVQDTDDCLVNGLSLDSGKIGKGYVFLACQGRSHHGLDFCQEAIDAGAVKILSDTIPHEYEARISAVRSRGLLLEIPGLKALAGPIAGKFYGYPSRRTVVIGVTGTNGKTSCCHYLAQLWDALGNRCALMGTMGNGYWDRDEGLVAVTGTGRTTEDAVLIQEEMARLNCDFLMQEVSSHGLDQGRVNGVSYEAAIFTNLSRDHLDYHGSMEDYGQAKLKLFKHEELAHVIVNFDDPFVEEILSCLAGHTRRVFYGVRRDCREFASVQGGDWITATVLGGSLQGYDLDIISSWGSGRASLPLLGDFNIYNALAALGTLLARGIDFNVAIDLLSLLRPVAGRMELFHGSPAAPTVVIDYAHTPDAMKRVMLVLRSYCAGSLVCLFGCGGQRDRGKRAMMGRAAEDLADRVILTDDNPRFEDPDQIIADIKAGLNFPGRVQVIRDRHEAINDAISDAGPDDIVLVAGKGHEGGQSVAGDEIPFSDRSVVRSCLRAR